MDSPRSQGSSGCPTCELMDADSRARSIGCSVWLMKGSYERKSAQPMKNTRKIAFGNDESAPLAGDEVAEFVEIAICDVGGGGCHEQD